MVDQLGRHDATGPPACTPGGWVDPEGYVRSRCRAREYLILHAMLVPACSLVLLPCEFGAAGVVVFVVIVALDLLIVVVIRCAQWWVDRGRRDLERYLRQQSPGGA